MTTATVTAPPAAVVTLDSSAPESTARARGRARVDLGVAAVVAAVAWWSLAAPRLWGGRGAGAVTAGAVLTGLAVLAAKPHRALPKRIIVAALLLSAAALGVAAVSPTGWAGATTAAGYVCASWTVIAVAAVVARVPRTEDTLVLVLVAGVMVEMAEAWLPWWGGANPAAPIIGTFYWYDPLAAFLIAGAVLGLSLWLRRRGPVAAFGMTGCVLGTIGLIYSTSRAAGVCAAVALLTVALTHIWRERGLGVLRSAVALAVTAGAAWVVGGPPFFAHRATPFTGTASRATGQSLSQNGHYRLDFWHEAVGVFARHPVAGGGYHSMATASVGHVPSGWPLSPLAHNGYLQALADGGLLLGLPFLVAVVAVAWWVVRALLDAVRRRDFSTGGFVVPLVLAGLLAHSAVDFDWSYAADLLNVAILAGLVIGRRVARSGGAGPQHGSRLVAGAVLAGVALTGVAAGTAWSGDLRQSLPIASGVAR